MSRDEFLNRLREGLAPLSAEERDAAVRYYEEFLDEALDEGVAMGELGDPDSVVKRILQENGVPAQGPTVVQTVTNPPFYKSVWFWLCAVFTLPVWLPLVLGLGAAALGIGLALVCVGLALVAVLLAVVLSLFAVVIAMVVGGLYACVCSFYLLPGYTECFLALFGLSLTVTAAGLLTGLGLTSLLAALFRRRRTGEGASVK